MKFLTKEVKIAIMAVVAIVLLFIGINFLKGINLFKGSNSYYVTFSDIRGLTVSNPVYANGYPVGIVREIEYDYSRTDKVVVRVELDKNMHVPAGTRAELETELMGGVKMTLVLGQNPTQHLAPGDTLAGGMHIGTVEKISEMLPALEGMVPKLDSILTNLNRLTADPALAQTLHNTAEMTAELKETAAGLNGMMKKDIPRMVGKFNRIGDNVETLTGNLAKVDVDGTMQEVKSTLDGVQQVTGNLSATTDMLNTKLNSKDNTMGLFLNDRSVYDNLNNTLINADALMIDLKQHPKRYVHFSIFGKKDK
ncbi:MAG: MCE family protein [Bacteroidaceae bacterium]|nr:MCE family protein [Bacteroidaceae bacterium]